MRVKKYNYVSANSLPSGNYFRSVGSSFNSVLSPYANLGVVNYISMARLCLNTGLIFVVTGGIRHDEILLSPF